MMRFEGESYLSVANVMNVLMTMNVFYLGNFRIFSTLCDQNVKSFKEVISVSS